MNYFYNRQVGLSIPIKLLSALAGFYIVTISISYLGVDNYGIWITIFTFVNWFSLMDFGVGGGLRNRFGEAVANQEDDIAHIYVSTAYMSLGAVLLLLVLLFYLFSYFVDWYWLFSVSDSAARDIRLIVIAVVVVFCLQLIGKLSSNLLYATHESHIALLPYFIYQTVFVVCLYLIHSQEYLSDDKLAMYSLVVLAATFFSYIAFNLYVFSKKFTQYVPRMSKFSWGALKNIYGIGIKFFFIQIFAVLLYSTDVFLLNFYTTEENVTTYTVLQKYYGVSLLVSGVMLGPVWSAVVTAKAKSDYFYLKRLIRKVVKIVSIITAATLGAVFVQKGVFEIWLDGVVQVDVMTSILMSVFIVVMVIMQSLSSFINGFGAVKLQMYSAGVASILNILLTIYGLVVLGYGMNWVIFVSILSNIPGMLLYVVQVNKLMQRKAVGVWGQ